MKIWKNKIKMKVKNSNKKKETCERLEFFQIFLEI